MKDILSFLVSKKEEISYIETKRLRLVPWKATTEDAYELFSFASNPRVGPIASWKPHESIEESLDTIREIFLPNFSFKIVRKEDNKTIGNIACEKDIHRPEIKSLELGYAIDEDYWNMGFATEASSKLIEWLFTDENLNLEVIYIQCNVNNIQSQKVINKLGFEYEGIRRHSDRDYEGKLRDVKTYSITRREYFDKHNKR